MLLISLIFLSCVIGNLLTIDQKNRYCGNNIDILELTIETAHQHFIKKRLSPLDLVQCYLNRINLMNQKLGNIIEVSNEAVEVAERLTLKQEWIPKPLYGIPVIISGSINTKDSMSTMLKDETISESEKRDAVIVKRLRQVGAIIIAKARGDVRQFPNPYNLRYNLTGCSAGSAIASNLAMLAVSVESDFFSLTSASELSLNAIKLTRDDVSMDNIFVTRPFEFSIVALTRNSIDCLKLFKALSTDAQGEPLDLITPFQDNSYLKQIFVNSFTKLVGFAREDLFGYFHKTQVPHIRELKKRLVDSDIKLTEILNISDELKECLKSYFIFYKRSPVGSEIDIERLKLRLPCAINDKLTLETESQIESVINTLEADALIIPYPIAAFLPQLPVMTIPSGFTEVGIPYGVIVCAKKIWTTNLFHLGHLVENQVRAVRFRPGFLS